MSLTPFKKKVQERKSFVYDAYINKPADIAVSTLVKELAAKFQVTEVRIYGDIKEKKNA